VPVPDGWQDHRCAYLLSGPPYDAEARQARERGWAVRRLPGAHLHQTVDPGGVARVLLELARPPAMTARPSAGRLRLDALDQLARPARVQHPFVVVPAPRAP
jgi:hypothetical protein